MTAQVAEHYPATPARLVVGQHTQLHDRLAYPSERMTAYLHWFARDVERKVSGDEDQLGMMWYPWRAHKTPEAASLWARDVARSLFQARTFQVTADIVDVVSGLYKGSQGRLFHLEEPELPAPHGFCWLDKPLRVVDKHGRIVIERAFTWGLMTVTARYDRWGEAETFPAVRLSSWNYVGDAESDDYWVKEPEAVKNLYSTADLMLSHTLVIPFGERHRYEAGPLTVDGKDYHPDSAAAWMHHLWMFMEQEIVATRSAPLDRATARRALRSIKQNAVSVVLLRRIRPVSEPSGEHRDVDWTCRWLVQGHHRHIDAYLGPRHHAVPGQVIDGTVCCAVCWDRDELVRLAWVKSYIKGPEDRPLRAVKLLHRVAR